MTFHLICLGLFLGVHFINHIYPGIRWKKQPDWIPNNSYINTAITATVVSVLCFLGDICLIVLDTGAYRLVQAALCLAAILFTIFTCLGLLKACAEAPVPDY